VRDPGPEKPRPAEDDEIDLAVAPAQGFTRAGDLEPQRGQEARFGGDDEWPASSAAALFREQPDPAESRPEVAGEDDLDAGDLMARERPGGNRMAKAPSDWARLPRSARPSVPRAPAHEHQRRGAGSRLLDEADDLTHRAAGGVDHDDEAIAGDRLTLAEDGGGDPRRRLEVRGNTPVGREADDPAAVAVRRKRRLAQLDEVPH
jgi:hypothetical protein